LKPLLLNLLTLSVTVVLLVALALPAKWTLDSARQDADVQAAIQAPWPHPDPDPSRTFGVYIDPWHIDDWARAVGAGPSLAAKFEAFSLRRGLDRDVAQVQRIGLRQMLVSWEPWTPVPAALGAERQATPQPGYRNIDIAGGSQDAYMLRFARSLARFHGTVYVRYAHEMNGYWYPWSHGPEAYVLAWRRMVRIFDEAGARNVRFVWSVNPSLYESQRTWRRGLLRYWPGSQYVDDVGSTMIDFGGVKSYPVARFEPRLRWLRSRFGKPLVLTETNTAFDGRLKWLADLRTMLGTMPWVRVVAWSQLPSRGNAQTVGTGVLDWDVQTDRPAAAELAAIIRDGSG
jgi:mannan endo-1,4-beta-mannosidase